MIKYPDTNEWLEKELGYIFNNKELMDSLEKREAYIAYLKKLHEDYIGFPLDVHDMQILEHLDGNASIEYIEELKDFKKKREAMIKSWNLIASDSATVKEQVRIIATQFPESSRVFIYRLIRDKQPKELQDIIELLKYTKKEDDGR